MRKEIIEYLNSVAEEVGRKEVENACKHFLKAPSRRSSISTKRQAIPKKWTTLAWSRQEGVCARCGRTLSLGDSTGDHKIPIVRGGTHTEDNIAALHKSCNSSKGAKSLIEESKASNRLFTEILS
jgi:5-methylcytosine-specific restriction endonuclease McrA